VRRVVLAAVALLELTPASAWARQDPTPPMTAEAMEQARPLTDAFFQALQAGETGKAYRDLFAGTLMEAKPEALQTLVTQTDVYLNAYGVLVSWQVIRTDCLSPTMCRMLFQLEMKNGPMFVMLLLHRSPSGWQANHIFVTDVGMQLFDLR
jgi:hypothetical protein